MAGLDPRLFTVAELWLIAEAKRQHDRQHAVNQSMMVWADFEKLDAVRFVRFGELQPPLTIDDVMSPTLRSQVEEEERKLRDGKPR